VGERQCVKVGEVVTVLQQTAQYVVVEWRSDPIADMVADAVLATILRLDDGGGGGAVAAVGGKAGVKVRVDRHPPNGLQSHRRLLASEAPWLMSTQVEVTGCC
jgi:hypothetical protein